MASLVSSLPILPKREPDSHKGDFGHALLIGGSLHMPGAITLATLAALRSGAGLTTLAAPQTTLQLALQANPCAMGLPLETTPVGFLAPDNLSKILAKFSPGCVLAIGPGFGREPNQDTLAVELFRHWPGTAVFDADALNALATTQTLLDTNSPRILTPHPGEFARLTKIPASDPIGQQQAAIELAASQNLVIVLKSHATLVTDGVGIYRNSTGNPSLAVGGSGDCLTGIITALVCQGLGPFDAAVLGVYLHGLAADIAHEQLGTPSTLGTDLIDSLPAAFRHYRKLIDSIEVSDSKMEKNPGQPTKNPNE